MAKAQRKKVAQSTPRPQPYAKARRLLVELLYLYCVSAGVAAIFALVHHLTGFDRPVVLWGCAEVFFFLYHRWRYFQLHANPVPNHILVADDEHFKDFLSLQCAIDFREFISGWFFHKEFSEIRKGNIFDFCAYAFLYKRRSDLTPKEAQRVNKWVDAIQSAYSIRFKEGYNRALDFMAHIFHPLQVIHKPLVWHIIAETLGAIPHAVLWLWGYHHHFHRGFSFWIADKHAVCSLPLVVPAADVDVVDATKTPSQLPSYAGPALREGREGENIHTTDSSSSAPADGSGTASSCNHSGACCSRGSKASVFSCCQVGGRGRNSRQSGSRQGKGGGSKAVRGQNTANYSSTAANTGCCCSGRIAGEASTSGRPSSSSSNPRLSHATSTAGARDMDVDKYSGSTGLHRSASATSFAELAMKYTPNLAPTMHFPSSLSHLPSFASLPSLPNLPSVSLPLSLPSWADLPTMPMPSFTTSLLSSLPLEMSLPSLPSFSSLPQLPNLSVTDLPVDLSFIPYLPLDLPIDFPAWPTMPNLPLSSLTKDVSLPSLPSLPSLRRLRSLSVTDLPSLPHIPSLAAMQSFASWPFRTARPPPPDALPIVFIHGVGFGLLPYLLFLRAMMLANPSRPFIVVEFRQVALRYCHTAADFNAMANSIVDMLKAHGYSQGCFVGHSFGTFVVARICHLHPEVVHSTMLIDPVSMLLCFPKTLHNFIYAPPNWKMLMTQPLRAVIDVLRWFCARDMGIAQTFCRGFHWHMLTLWPRQMRRDKSLVVLSGEDDLVPSAHIKRYLEHHGEGLRLIHLPKYFHGMFLLMPKTQQKIIQALCEMLDT